VLIAVLPAQDQVSAEPAGGAGVDTHRRVPSVKASRLRTEARPVVPSTLPIKKSTYRRI
jgi:hypothetical protein